MNTDYIVQNTSSDMKTQSAVERLTLVNFRNYYYLNLEVNSPFIVLSGENGSGKTNVLEALSFLSQGRGFRNAKLSDVLTFSSIPKQKPLSVFSDSNGWTVAAQILKNGENFTLGTSVEKQIIETDYDESKVIERRTAQVNGKRLASQNEFGNYLSLIWVIPQMDKLFIGGAQHRRHFLDRIVCSFDTDHTRRLSLFDNMYRQWLQVLKSGKNNNNWLLSLEDRLSRLAVSISAARCEQVDKLNYFIKKNPDDVFPTAILELDGTIEKMLSDKAAVYVEDYYRETLFNMRQSILDDSASFSINKTDLKVVYEKKNIPASLCSTGEQKSLLLSIILSQARCLTSSRGYPPILLLDEIAAHLDAFKRSAFLSKVNELNTQAWLTTTDYSEFSDIQKKAQFLKVMNNNLYEF